MNMNKINRKIQSAVVAAALVLGCASSANAAITLVQTEDGWTVQLMGLISAFTGNSDFDNGESSTRVITGFNPSKLEAVVVAPEYNGMTISA
ncbi:MAG: hypothetical protein LC637_04780, partial [Xanthomonadaceae bacterium]|nr:hypothetical protein [Xanthomonadaceae bacterium]